MKGTGDAPRGFAGRNCILRTHVAWTRAVQPSLVDVLQLGWHRAISEKAMYPLCSTGAKTEQTYELHCGC